MPTLESPGDSYFILVITLKKRFILNKILSVQFHTWLTLGCTMLYNRFLEFVCFTELKHHVYWLVLHTSALPPTPRSYHSIFCFLWLSFLQIPPVSGITQYLSFFNWLISLSIIPSRFTHGVACCKISFFLKTGIPWYVYAIFSEHLGCFHILAVMHNSAMNMRVLITFQNPDSTSCEIAGSLIFRVNSTLFCIVTSPLYIPNSAHRFQFLHFLTSCHSCSQKALVNLQIAGLNL